MGSEMCIRDSPGNSNDSSSDLSNDNFSACQTRRSSRGDSGCQRYDSSSFRCSFDECYASYKFGCIRRNDSFYSTLCFFCYIRGNASSYSSYDYDEFCGYSFGEFYGCCVRYDGSFSF